MKLVVLLAKYLPEWPEGCEYITQSHSAALWDHENQHIPIDIHERAIDRTIAKVTQSQYLAARDRLHAATVKDIKQPTPTQKPTEWLEIAKDQFHIITKSKTCRETLSFAQAAEFAFDAADAFIHEMEKRK